VRCLGWWAPWKEGWRAFLGHAPALVRVKLVLVAGLEDGGVAPGSGQRQVHGLLEQLEALDLVDGGLGGLGLVEDDKGLALGLEVGLGDDVDDVAILGEDGAQGFLEDVGLDALFEVAHVNAVGGGQVWSVARPGHRGGHALYVSECNDTYVAMGGCAMVSSSWFL
jgi:hypothetical protein